MTFFLIAEVGERFAKQGSTPTSSQTCTCLSQRGLNSQTAVDRFNWIYRSVVVKSGKIY